MRGLILAAGLAALALGACETAEGYRQRVARYIGASSDALVLEWGSPTSVDELSDGSEMWTYYVERRQVSGGRYVTVPSERRVTVTDDDGRERTRVEEYEDTIYEPPREWFEPCETRFVISPEGRVRDFRFIGPGCRAIESGPAG